MCIRTTPNRCCLFPSRRRRLQELRVTQAEKMRQELVANQSYELQEAARINAEESAKWEAQWAIQLTEYERNLEAQARWRPVIVHGCAWLCGHV